MIITTYDPTGYHSTTKNAGLSPDLSLIWCEVNILSIWGLPFSIEIITISGASIDSIGGLVNPGIITQWLFWYSPDCYCLLVGIRVLPRVLFKWICVIMCIYLYKHYIYICIYIICIYIYICTYNMYIYMQLSTYSKCTHMNVFARV